MEKVIINIDGKEFKAEYSDSNPNVFINKKPYQVEMMRQMGTNIFSFSVNNKMCQIEFEYNEFAKSHIILDGMTFDIDITTETKKLLSQYLKQSGSGKTNGAGVIKAPMPGLVIKIMVEEGQQVNRGDKIVIVEAMKMENALQSPIDGIVKFIKVREGQAVEKDAVLLEIVDSL
ncbi:MAG: acetyl-CoA carboxylase biotin carboxyl carrier protein subunit [bacterium]